MISPRLARPILFVLALIIAYGFSVSARLDQYREWNRDPTRYFVGGSPMMTTLDSYYWIRWAKEYSSGSTPETDDSLRFFPDGADPPKTVPPLSFLIALAAPFFQGDFYRAGFFLSVGLAGLFIFPLGWYFYRLNVPVAGLLGGVIASVSVEYLIRTGIGRVDTNTLMLFFFSLIALLTLVASQGRRPTSIFVASSLVGLATFMLGMWWQKSAFAILLFGALFLSLLIAQSENKERTPRSKSLVSCC